MALILEWVVECCLCKKSVREKAKALDLIFDSNPVPVSQPKLPGWETDGLGAWMCVECYKLARKTDGTG